jgi:hypothetical protein
LTRVTGSDRLDEAPQHMQNVGKRLSENGLGKEGNEIDRISFIERYSDFGVVLESSDAGTVSGTWIDNDHRRLAGIQARPGAVCVRRQDSQKHVVDRPFKNPGIEDRFEPEIQKRRQPGSFVLEHVVGTLTQGVPEQN